MLTATDPTETNLELPFGYAARPAKLDDVDAVVAVYNASARALTGADEHTAAEWRSEWQTPGFDPATDARVVLAPDGQVAGAVSAWLPAPYTLLEQWGRVHPAHTGRGLGRYLFRWAEARARRAAEQAAQGETVVLDTWLLATDQAARDLLRQQGCAVARRNLRMQIEFGDEAPPALQPPPGITLRAFVPGQDDVQTYATIRASFRDAWGFVESPFEEGLERWRHRWQNSPDFDPSLRFLAVDGDQVIGTAFSQLRVPEDPSLAWIFTVGVRREWRQRGVAQALLQACFAALHARGQRKIALGVDAASPTGATRLYERAGMRPVPEKTYEVWQKEQRK
ncbi:MAG: GNAT family N-acetyltransferase [Anaerolineales bacterium]|nr:GNAT family N-acetyltransferase [Anaerolineales bacterium]